MERKIEKALRCVQKPARYIGGERGSVKKDRNNVSIRFGLAFPDIYEVGMSHLGIKILYDILNRMEDVWCERVFAPWIDFEKRMRQDDIPLFALESGDKVSDFDILGFSLMYEMSYTDVLNMLELAGIPLRTEERSDKYPIIICGGPCTCNPEPMAEFIDLFCLGDGEEVICEVVELYRECASKKLPRNEFLYKAASIEGVYVPSLYEVTWKEDGTISAVMPKMPGIPEKIRKRVVKDLDKAPFPKNFILPYIDIIHDRSVIEAFRGCVHGCRFCQAGFIYRPVRERLPQTLNLQARSLCAGMGYDEISISSLSTSDYSGLNALLNGLLSWTAPQKIGLTLPSLRIDNFSDDLIEKISSVRKSGLTFAPEAGTQRLRDIINKNITEDQILNTCRKAFSGGWTSVKLYFMLGLPYETREDIEGIADLAQKIVDIYYHLPEKPKGRSVNVSVSVSTFVPKPFTPFQWAAQDSIENIGDKQRHLRSCIHSKKISLSTHEAERSILEAALARGDRRLCGVLSEAHRLGCRLASWNEAFDFDRWLLAFKNCGIDPAFYAGRMRDYSEILPWDHIDYGIKKSFLQRESIKAASAECTSSCREACSFCGADLLEGGCKLCRR